MGKGTFILVVLALAALFVTACERRDLPTLPKAETEDTAVYCVPLEPEDACSATGSMGDNSAVVRDRGKYFYCVSFARVSGE